jgi:hypothetical protein
MNSSVFDILGIRVVAIPMPDTRHMNLSTLSIPLEDFHGPQCQKTDSSFIEFNGSLTEAAENKIGSTF